MKIYLTTDTHFNHAKLTEFTSRRPENHWLITGKHLLDLNKTKVDVLIHLGDVAIGKDKEMHETYIKPLKMKKWLIKGNHDHKSDFWYLTHGWDMVCDQFTATFFGKKIYFSHIPVAWDGYYDVNIHGHFHDSDYRRHEPELMAIKNGYQKLLAIEYTDLKPISLENFLTKEEK
ncbi:MAG: hypothetical protein PHE73_09200 [Sulfurovaceae bacterium]|nr:hypothetical protein [Sulfurovaceae bacterium]